MHVTPELAAWSPAQVSKKQIVSSLFTHTDSVWLIAPVPEGQPSARGSPGPF